MREHFSKYSYNNYSYLVLISSIRPSSTKASYKDIKDIWEKSLRWKKFPLNFYINFPFCVSKCHFCRQPSTPLKENNINKYVVNLVKILEYFDGVFLGHKFSSLYVGGGTPSLMDVHHIKLFLTIYLKILNSKKTQKKHLSLTLKA